MLKWTEYLYLKLTNELQINKKRSELQQKLASWKIVYIIEAWKRNMSNLWRPAKKIVLTKKENKGSATIIRMCIRIRGLPLQFEFVLGSNETYLSNVKSCKIDRDIVYEPRTSSDFYISFNELQHLIGSGTCSDILGTTYVTELRPWYVVLTFRFINVIISERKLCKGSLNWKTFIMYRARSFLLWKYQLLRIADFYDVP